MPAPRSPRLAAALACALACGATAGAQPLRMSGEALGFPATIEVRDLSAETARAAVGEAFVELAAALAELRALEAAAAGGGAVAVTPPQLALVRRAVGFCRWSEGALGPLGGRVYALWGVRSPVRSRPTPEALADAAAAAACDGLRLDEAAGTLTVTPQGALDFYPFELGWAVDRAAERLRARGARNFWIDLGRLRLGAGGGPDGNGWAVAPPPVAGLDVPLAPFFLRDRAAAMPTARDRPLRVAGDELVPFFDLRRGRPGSGVAAVFAVTELAVDADALAQVMFALGPSSGSLLLGNLEPRPSLRWFLGSGDGPPLLTDVNWSVVVRP